MDSLEMAKERFKDDPREVTTYTTKSGQVIVVVGDLDIKRLFRKALAELS